MADAEARLLDLALDHVTRLKDELDDDIVNLCDDLGGKLSRSEMEDMNDETDSLKDVLSQRRRKISSLLNTVNELIFENEKFRNLEQISSQAK